MADDIDDLLDEVESKYCSDNKRSSSKKPTTSLVVAQTKPKKETRSKGYDLNDVIDDIMSDDGIKISLNQDTAVSKDVTKKFAKNETGAKLKCFSVFVGGSSSATGAASTSSQRTCDRLHCTSCDNQVVFFNDFKWADEQCNYLAFRNNYPDFSRLKSLLVPRKGFRAYCCQCSWLATKELVDLNSKYTFKWICRRH